MSQPPGHFDIDRRQSYRNAGSSIQYYIQTTVAGIIIVGAVSAEAQLLKQIIVRDADEPGAVGASVPAQARVQLGGNPVEHFKVGCGVQAGAFDGRHFESGGVERHPGFVT